MNERIAHPDRRPGGGRGRPRLLRRAIRAVASGPGLRRGDENGKRLSLLTLPFLLIATPAFAHSGHGTPSGFVAGLVHPFTGLDHLLTMLMVGLWAGIAFPRQWWLCPAAFMVFMLGGFAYGVGGGSLPVAELLIVTSLAALGLALLVDLRPPLALSAAVVALFAVGHGFAHGSEMAPGADAIDFAGGFLISTAALHAVGLAVARHLSDRAQVRRSGANPAPAHRANPAPM